ncbi:DHH family phosphoesterase [Desulfurococcus mucosus]|uniref:Phosphoesterase DHHA1 n=1 Tax=Desulfurococcus mucosus (strain ATCC 35584 / DSM 2162 / JCM 9187 / O7/1) TaxID=765177 RepID=E8R7Y1_DESM0|nr:DHHA1 domain-containing protein [Desulfurococcus mucosus]ADV64607.1 phosphoesterase DHHA1 [Desulfurococcus mucosus DSM 2162]
MGEALIITHTDMDGVAAAALYIYLNKLEDYRVYFTEPYGLHEALGKAVGKGFTRIALMDLGVNPPVFNRVVELLGELTGGGSRVSWFDHHVWEDEWVKAVEGSGVVLHIDTSTCATGVVYKYSERKGSIDPLYVSSLVNGVCAGDLWRFDHWLGPYYVRLVRRRDGDGWRRRVLETLSKGVFWDPLFEEKVVEAVEAELGLLGDGLKTVVREVDGFRICVAESSDTVENSFLASYLMGRFNADVAVIASSDGKLSLRSRGVNVRDIAVALGGGGHLTASGARIPIPFKTRLLSRLSKTMLLEHVADRVLDHRDKLRRL